jgi:endoglucanase
MRLRARSTILAACLSGSLFTAAAGHAAPYDAHGFRLSATAYTVGEAAGDAVITIVRDDTSREAQIRYIARPGTAERGFDFWPVKAMINFLPGQARATFKIPIINHGLPGLAKTVRIGLFGPSPIGMGRPSQAVLTILNNDPANIVQEPFNPLGLAVTPPSGAPLEGAQAYVDPQSWWAIEAAHLRRAHRREASMMDVIAREPVVIRFGNWTPNPGVEVSQLLVRASVEHPGSVPEISTYWIVTSNKTHRHCGTYSDSAARARQYHKWIEGLAHGIGDYRAILFLEEDSLITVGCLSHHGLAVRLGELRDAVNVLRQDPRLVVYLDAGAADALQVDHVARLLRRAGVAKAEGFFLNATHFDWTRHEIHYGDGISALTGGKHFVVNTAQNGQGPLHPPNRVHNGNEVLCNPPGRGLGPLPTFDTGYRNVDAFAWIQIPGKSGGQCRPGAPPTGMFWPALALELVRGGRARRGGARGLARRGGARGRGTRHRSGTELTHPASHTSHFSCDGEPVPRPSAKFWDICRGLRSLDEALAVLADLQHGVVGRAVAAHLAQLRQRRDPETDHVRDAKIIRTGRGWRIRAATPQRS